MGGIPVWVLNDSSEQFFISFWDLPYTSPLATGLSHGQAGGLGLPTHWSDGIDYKRGINSNSLVKRGRRAVAKPASLS
jgi:hypothetical protein